MVAGKTNAIPMISMCCLRQDDMAASSPDAGGSGSQPAIEIVKNMGVATMLLYPVPK